MKNIATLVRNLPADKYQELAGAVNDVFENKRFQPGTTQKAGAKLAQVRKKGGKMKIRDLSIHSMVGRCAYIMP
ncbi:MAG: hypothetical protein ACLUQ6_02320 [Alistipes onderdonkii]